MNVLNQAGYFLESLVKSSMIAGTIWLHPVMMSKI